MHSPTIAGYLNIFFRTASAVCDSFSSSLDSLVEQGKTLMPLRSKVAVLPAEVRNELERRIVEKAFSDYQDLSEWLQTQGYHIAHDSIQRHGLRLRQKIEAMELLGEEAKALSAAVADAGETIVDAAVMLIHQRVFSIPSNARDRVAQASLPAHLIWRGGERTARDRVARASLPARRIWRRLAGRARNPPAQATAIVQFMATAAAPRSKFVTWPG